jgi:hypothetical protein
MKFAYSIVLLAMTMLLSPSSSRGQSAPEVLGQIQESLIDGNADRLVSFFNERIEITLMGQRQVHSQKQALYVMRQFFSNYPPNAFRVRHKGDTGGTFYALGEYQSAKGQFEVNLFIKLSTDGHRINEIRFERL